MLGTKDEFLHVDTTVLTNKPTFTFITSMQTLDAKSDDW